MFNPSTMTARLLGCACGGWLAACSSAPPLTPLSAQDQIPDLSDPAAAMAQRNRARPCQVTQHATQDGTADRDALVTYAYDAQGRASQDVATDSTDSFEQRQYSWTANQLTEVMDSVDDNQTGSNAESVETLTYDAAGDLVTDTTQTTEDGVPGFSTAFTFGGFDGHGHPAQASVVVVSYDLLSDTGNYTTTHTTHGYSYDPQGRRTAMQIVDDAGNPVPGSWTTVYDDADHTATTTTTLAGGTSVTIYNFDAAYDLASWTTVDQYNGTTGASPPTVEGTATFDGGRETSETWTYAGTLQATQTESYGCSADDTNAAQDKQLGPETANPVQTGITRLAIEAPRPPL